MNAAPEADMPKGPLSGGGAAPTPSELAPEAIWQEGLEHLLAILGTTPAGLSGAEANARLAIYGPTKHARREQTGRP